MIESQVCGLRFRAGTAGKVSEVQRLRREPRLQSWPQKDHFDEEGFDLLRPITAAPKSKSFFASVTVVLAVE